MSMTGLTISPVSLSGFPTDYRGYTDIAPFTYRSAATYEEIQESIRTWLLRTLVPNLTANFDATDASYLELRANVQAQVDRLTTEINSAIAARAVLDEGFTPVVNVLAHGAVGDGVTDDTAAVQAAITAALAASDPADVQLPRGNGQPVTVFFPKGTYSVNALHVPGTIRLAGEGSYAYASAILLQRTAGQSTVVLEADTDGTSNATTFDNLGFKSAVGTSDAGTASVRAVPGIGSNSIYFRNCWFATPERRAILVPHGDDIKIVGCTFDVSAFDAIKLGDLTAGTTVTNAVIADCTFFDIALTAVDASNVVGLTVANNRAYGAGTGTRSFIRVGNGEAVTVTGNTISGGYARFVELYNGQVITIAGNTAYKITDVPVYVGGGQVLYGVTVVGNTLASDGALAHGALWIDGTGLTVSTFSKNTIMPGAVSTRMIDASDARVTGNDLAPNASFRFSSPSNVADPASNGL